MVPSSTGVSVPFWRKGINVVGYWTVSAMTAQWRWGFQLNGCTLGCVALGGFVSILIVIYGDFMLTGFMGLAQAEARFVLKINPMELSAAME